MFERSLYTLTYCLFAIIVWMAATPVKAWEYSLDDFSTSDWGTSSGWGSCSAYSQSRPCISNGSYFGVDSGDVVFSYTYANIYDVVDVSDMSYSYDSSKTYYISFDAMVGPRNSEQGNKTEYLSVAVYYKKSDNSLIGSESFNQTINNTSMETFEFELSDTMLSHPSLDNLQIIISGRDNGYWNGNYGMVVANGSVQLTDYDPTAPTYSSDPTAAQLQSRTDARNITTNGNAIYVNQSGDRVDIDITQYDNDNLVAGTSSTANNITDATITGDDNTVNITQGNNAGSFSDDNVTLLDIDGTNNTLTVRQGDNVDDVGGHRSSTNIVGNYNTLGILQQNDGGVGSNGHFMEIDVAGNSNVMYMDQKDDGDKMLFMDINGSSNDVDIIQQGTGEHFLDVTAGSNQTIDVLQDGSGSHAATINMSGYTSTLDLDQSGSTDKTYSLNQVCTNANGCGTTTITQN